MSKNIALACFSIIFGVLIIEIILHSIAPLGYIRGNIIGTYPNSDLPRHEVPSLGSMFKPHATGTSKYYCYQTPIQANEFGFHDHAWPQELSGGIALIGDSFLRSEQVPLSSTTASLMRAELGIPIISAGNNTLGTLGEIALYQKYIKLLHPSMVMLFFFPENDITDNHCAHNTQSRCATINSEGSLALQDNGTQTPQPPLMQFMRKYCFSCNIIRNKFTIARTVHTTDHTDESWRITEIALNEFQKELKKDGATLVVVIVPGGDVSHERYTPNEKKAIELMKRLTINTLELRPAFSTYIQKFKVQDPLLSFWCDAHWNPVGHYIAAEQISAYVRQSGLIRPLPMPYKEKDFLSPELLLGEEAFTAIYRHGLYTPLLAN